MNRKIKFIYALLVITIIGSFLSFILIKYSEKYLEIINSTQNTTFSELSPNQKLNSLWKSFSYKGNPVHPKCFESLLSEDKNIDKLVVNLDNCSVYDLNKEKAEGNFDPAYYFNYDLPEHEDGYTTGYIWYVPIAKDGNTYYIKYGENSGGTGQFTSVVSVEKKDNKLYNIKYISNMGDRCNGGVGSVPAGLNAKSFLYYVNLTPIDIIDYVDPNNKLKAYVDLESSAASCFGKAYLRYDFISKESSFEYIDIDTEIDIDENEEWSDNYTYQSCFNKLYDSYIKRGDTKLNDTKLKIFYKEFGESCVN